MDIHQCGYTIHLLAAHIIILGISEITTLLFSPTMMMVNKVNYPLVICYSLLLNIAIEIVSCPMKKMVDLSMVFC